MEMYYITFRSVTYAQRGQRVLQTAGISCSLLRTPRWMESKGCGYALKLGDYKRAEKLLREKEIAFQKIYGILGENRAKEVPL